jgi:phage terminase small subunit
MANTLPATADELTPTQHAFVAEYMANGGNATAAYRVTADTDPARSYGAMRVDAHRMLHQPAVARRVSELRRIAAEALNTSVSELALQAHELATASVHELQPIEVYACAVCHSADGKHAQWIDADDYADACEAWAASLGTPKPLRKPSAAGGFGRDTMAAPNPECRSCRGHGIPVMRTRPTAELSPGARQLFEGATVAPDGTLRVMVADRAKWADMRNKLLGLYVVKTESKSLSVSMTAAEAAEIAARPVDEIVRLLFKPKVATP